MNDQERFALVYSYKNWYLKVLLMKPVSLLPIWRDGCSLHIAKWTLCTQHTVGVFLGERRDRIVTEQKSEFVYHIYECTSINSVFPRYWESVLPCWMVATERLLVERKSLIESYQLPAIPLKKITGGERKILK